ncbi:MAG: phospholipid carrier-dependent glycosyltransferase [Synergistaceae bacterium]|jgi:4-amino-4-deoxy-L-arabinose transferase-like glycosyltransferase|nr:phospholipid carrier-dependent glycosyltransferase [Synergistaceae bacterium]
MGKAFALLSAGLAVLTLFFGLGGYGLIDPDEGRYAEIPREMLETGDFITPRLNYVEYFEKPVLHYWLTAASFAVFGRNEFAARLVPALCALGGAGLVFVLARRNWDRDAGVCAAAILSSGLLWFAIARLNILDMTVSFFITLAVAGFWMACEERVPGESEASGRAEKSRRYLLLFYAGMAFATLTKGLIGVVLPGGIAFWTVVFTRRWGLIRRTLYRPGIVLFFLLTVPWFWAVCAENGDFFHFFFVREHFLRYATSMHDRYEPFWFFLPVLAAGLLPWTGLLPGMFGEMLGAVRRGNGGGRERFSGVLLGLWFAVPFVFFSLSGSKLVPYIVPCLPPLAISGGRLLALMAKGGTKEGKEGGETGSAKEKSRKKSTEKSAGRFVFLNGAVLSLAAAAGVVYPLMDKKAGAELCLYTLPAAASLALFAFCGVFFHRRREYGKMVRVLCVLAFVNAAVFSRGFAFKARLDSCRDLAAAIRERAAPEDIVVSYRDIRQSLAFYLNRRIVLAEVLGELRFGAEQEKDPRWFIGREALEALWSGKKRVFLAADTRETAELSLLLKGNPVIELNRTRNDVLLSNFSNSQTVSE